MLRNWQYASLEPYPCLNTSSYLPPPHAFSQTLHCWPLCSLFGRGTDKPIPSCVLFLSEVSTFRLNSFTNQRNEYLKIEFPTQIKITKLILQQENSKHFHVTEGHKYRPASEDGSVQCQANSCVFSLENLFSTSMISLMWAPHYLLFSFIYKSIQEK